MIFLFVYLFDFMNCWQLVCNDAWYDIADSVFECNENVCWYNNIREPPDFRQPIFFVPQHFIKKFTEQKKQTPYVVVSANHVDACAPFGSGTSGGGSELLEDVNLTAWFATNVAISHMKLHPIPLGPKVQWHTRWFHQEENSKLALSKILLNNDPMINFFTFDRPYLIDLHMTIGNADFSVCKLLKPEQSRRSAAAHFEMLRNHIHESQFECPIGQELDAKLLYNENIDADHVSQIKYFNKLRCTKFVPVPEGAGLDTHRLYEALMMGAIPIVIDFPPMAKMFSQLPVLRVDKWSDVTVSLLNKTYDELHATTNVYNWDRLESHIWIEEILHYANKH